MSGKTSVQGGQFSGKTRFQGVHRPRDQFYSEVKVMLGLSEFLQKIPIWEQCVWDNVLNEVDLLKS